ncbi:MAG: hypothetical protein GY778_21120, partial [bacterium]|nr:hypothetical protein [bacterium]
IRPPEFDAGRVGAQLCRARADWSLGMSASRAVIGNVGRVQTPVLGIIVDAFRKHMGAATSAFFKVTATGCGTDFEYRDALGSDNNKIAAKPAANKIAEEIKAGTATVVSADVRSSAKSAPTLFDLALLQVAASAAHKMSAKAVLATVQSLYEAGIVSYPRTDFKLLSADAADDLVALLKANLPKGVNAADLDVSKVTTTEAMAHQALHVKKVATNLTGDQAKVYRLIFDRCVAAMLPAHVSDRQTIWVQSGGHYLRADLAKTTSAGFAAVDKKALNKDTLLTLNAGDTVALSDVAAVEAKTKKPPVMTEARLLKLMANPKALLANEEADLDRLDALTRASGLGTPATRDSYCPGLETRGLIKIQAGGKLIPTDKGIKLVSRLESTQETSVFLSPTITADWEGRLNEMEAATTVADATAQFKAFTAEFDRFLTDSMGPLKALRGIYGSASVTPCPKCDDGLLDAVSYDKGKKNFISCSNNEKGNENSKCDLFVWLAATKATATKLPEVATGPKAAR